MTLGAINRSPIKSCRGAAVTEAAVEPWGLAGDRRWLVVDDDGVLLTAREHRRLLLAVPTPGPDGALHLTSPDAPDLTVPVPTGDELVPVSVWGTELLAALASTEAAAWFSKVAGRPARLVYLDDPTRRRPSPEYA